MMPGYRLPLLHRGGDRQACPRPQALPLVEDRLSVLRGGFRRHQAGRVSKAASRPCGSGGQHATRRDDVAAGAGRHCRAGAFRR